MNQIEVLRKFFRITNASFQAANLITKAVTGTEPRMSEMQRLHKIALECIEKDEPDMLYMDSLLQGMEELAERNKKDSEL